MTWTLRLGREIVSANAHRVNAGHLWQMAQYRRERNAWAHDLIFEALRQGVVLIHEHNRPVRRVTITRVYGKRKREYDHGNIVGGCKALVDAMLPTKLARVTTWQSGPRKGKPRIVPPVPGAGLIVDDSPRWVTIEYRQERGERPGTVITLEDVA